MQRLIRRISRLFFRPKLSHEAFEAYFYRLPDKIQVSWQRDGKFIVGKISDGKHEFVTQGRNPEEFIEMVNDALITVHEIPVAYIDALKTARKTYEPSLAERQELENEKVDRSIFSFTKSREILRLA